MITVVNKKYHKPTNNDFYIGRGSPLGNPASNKYSNYNVVRVDTVEQAIYFYKGWLRAQIENKNNEICNELFRILSAAKNNDVYLVCFCKQPGQNNLCHGDEIKEVVERYLLNESK